MGARTEPPERDCEVVVEDLDTEPRMIFLFSLNAAINLRRRRQHGHHTRHTDAEKRHMERRSDLHSTRKRSLGRQAGVFILCPQRERRFDKDPGADELPKARTCNETLSPCFSNCPIRGTGPSARPRKNAASPTRSRTHQPARHRPVQIRAGYSSYSPSFRASIGQREIREG